MKQLTLAEIERALSKRRKPKTAKKAHKKTAKKAGPLRGAAKAEFLARMKRGRARARRA